MRPSSDSHGATEEILWPSWQIVDGEIAIYVNFFTEGLHMSELVLTQTQSGIRISATPADVIVIRLAEHPTTGYRWQVENAAGLVLIGNDFTLSSSALGTGGERTFRFAVQQSGTAQIALSLRRPWEEDTAPPTRFEVTVEVGRP